MRAVRASAPGKAVLIGEYAVLGGAPALVMAVDRRAYVEVGTCERDASSVAVPQLGFGPVPFRLGEAGCVEWLDEVAYQPSFQRALSTLEWQLARRADQLEDIEGLKIRIDTSELYQSSATGAIKLGLGSSAAMSVALAGALETLLNPASTGRLPNRLQDELLEPYRLTQGGQGSGVDLAASLRGGVSSYQLKPDGPLVSAMSLPERLRVAFVWTGQAVSTADFLTRFNAWQAREGVAAEAILLEMEQCCRQALESLAQSDSSGVMTCINKYRQSMGKIGVGTGLPVISSSLQSIADVATEHGLASKPCGAGGGDIAMLAGADHSRLEEALSVLAMQGWPNLHLQPADQGLTVETISD
jgi:phosphomevalonate kinase